MNILGDDVKIFFFSPERPLKFSRKVRCCVLWSCRRSPLSPKMVFQWSHCDHGSHTQNTEPVGEGGNPGGEGVGEEKQEKERQERRTRQTLMRECVLRVASGRKLATPAR